MQTPDKIAQQPLSWSTVLAEAKRSEAFKTVTAFVNTARQQGKTIYPAQSDVFNAFRYTEYTDVKVVILGQDPYHGPNQAHGLAFSVRKNQKIPPSLRNIYKELCADIGGEMPHHGDLSAWAKQGVLLLNTVLTVEAHRPNSHKNKGWEIFTEAVIKQLNQAPQSIVYLLWGSAAEQKSQLIDKRHTMLKAPHPSPLSAYRGFFGCRHFSRTNAILAAQGQQPIDWNPTRQS
ncbi:uracil-DNA glycosylase [Ostreibacterium oceani]|uniref:Uracil-DNA glycosylase n=1 Tax=Ostreibacterium oceani TaxID=2654998 RepID=A0A6N7F0J7_9GAMM|nr:uracil-DNA glycosylase [Ostreibacterium oceani]MPV86308.1 uracil-DNA glycosylase [Ostreibacterium oceani]